jgi:hypothetical protein
MRARAQRAMRSPTSRPRPPHLVRDDSHQHHHREPERQEGECPERPGVEAVARELPVQLLRERTGLPLPTLVTERERLRP